MSRVLVFSKGLGRRVLSVYLDEIQKMIEVESDGETMAVVRVDKSGDAVCYTPANEEDSRPLTYWRPINTAPAGMRVLVMSDYLNPRIAIGDTEGHWFENGDGDEISPTIWLDGIPSPQF